MSICALGIIGHSLDSFTTTLLTNVIFSISGFVVPQPSFMLVSTKLVSTGTMAAASRATQISVGSSLQRSSFVKHTVKA